MQGTDIKAGDNEAYGPVRLYRSRDGASLLLFLDWSTGHTAQDRVHGWRDALLRATALGYTLTCESPQSSIADVDSYMLMRAAP